LRFKNRREVRRLRAKRRTERWVQNIRDEQYRVVKVSVAVGKQPFIIGGVGNPYMDLFSKVFVISLAHPIDNCVMCQCPLDNIEECGGPYSLPCGHMFHLNCMEELFTKRAESDDKESSSAHYAMSGSGTCEKCQTFMTNIGGTSRNSIATHQAQYCQLLMMESKRVIDLRHGFSDRKSSLMSPSGFEKRTGTRSNIRLRGPCKIPWLLGVKLRQRQTIHRHRNQHADLEHMLY